MMCKIIKINVVDYTLWFLFGLILGCYRYHSDRKGQQWLSACSKTE